MKQLMEWKWIMSLSMSMLFPAFLKMERPVTGVSPHLPYIYEERSKKCSKAVVQRPQSFRIINRDRCWEAAVRVGKKHLFLGKARQAGLPQPTSPSAQNPGKPKSAKFLPVLSLNTDMRRAGTEACQ